MVERRACAASGSCEVDGDRTELANAGLGEMAGDVTCESGCCDCDGSASGLYQLSAWAIYEYGTAGIAYSSTASKGPTVLRRGKGWEMFLPWRRTLLVGDNVESMLCWILWQTDMLDHDMCVV